MRARVVLALVCCAAPASLLASGASDAAGKEQAFVRGTATIATSSGRIVLGVELARTPDQRSQGLMNRRSLGARAGMVFEYPRQTTGAFWMKDTLIPLDIAFYDAGGRILRTLRMAPCTTGVCPLYDPGVAYRGALEVNAGSFRRWGVRRGDRIVVRGV